MSADDRREAVCRSAMTLIAERGLERTTMRAIGDEAEMSAGHVLYYFGSKDRVLLETLRWSEEDLTTGRRSWLTSALSADKKLARFIAAYLPAGRRDPRWALWMEIMRLAPDDRDTRTALRSIEDAWAADLASIVTSRGKATESLDFMRRLLLTLDGLALEVFTGSTSRRTALSYAKTLISPLQAPR